jgi:pre-mRNA-splicing factor ATP-dependent RNA helicase DHX38/PRP16
VFIPFVLSFILHSFTPPENRSSPPLDPEDRAEWEEEQKRLDRAWYSIDDGADDEQNPFGNMSNEYMAKKEKQMEEKKKKKMSAKARQIHKVKP